MLHGTWAHLLKCGHFSSSFWGFVWGVWSLVGSRLDIFGPLSLKLLQSLGSPHFPAPRLLWNHLCHVTSCAYSHWCESIRELSDCKEPNPTTRTKDTTRSNNTEVPVMVQTPHDIRVAVQSPTSCLRVNLAWSGRVVTLDKWRYLKKPHITRWPSSRHHWAIISESWKSRTGWRHITNPLELCLSRLAGCDRVPQYSYSKYFCDT